MAQEIERKFLVRDDTWRADVERAVAMAQGYIASGPEATVRVRIEDERAYMTIKGATRGLTRSEFQYPIPLDDARQMLDELCEDRRLEKTRHLVPHGAYVWEVDVFEGDNAPLVLAEIELSHPDEAFERPEWLGEEVSHDERYFNACLVLNPYCDWAPK